MQLMVIQKKKEGQSWHKKIDIKSANAIVQQTRKGRGKINLGVFGEWVEFESS